MKKLVCAVLLLFAVNGPAFAKEYKAGTDYLVVNQQETDTGDKIEVLEFFWYGCPHCYKFEPVLSNWISKKPSNVEFIRVPVVFRPEWKVHARTYYALQVMGVGEKLHVNIFDEIHKSKKNKLDTEASMTQFVVGHGIDKKEFTETFNSFSIDNMMRKAIKSMQGYNIQGVPAMAVNGKYLISGTTAGSYENMMRIVDYLISKESASSGL